MSYQQRTVDAELDALFPYVAAMALDGAKGVGKTTTAQQRVSETLRLDTPNILQPVAAAPEQILSRNRPLLIDEWQKVPEVWDVIRHAVDDDRTGGQFLLTGSATPNPKSVSHSGAGRIGRLRMRPMTLQERGIATPTISLSTLLSGKKSDLQGQCDLTLGDYVEEIVASGFPGLRELPTRARSFQLDSYLQNAVEKDVPEQGLLVRRPEAMMAWLRAYAAASSTTANYSQILNAATPGQSEKPSKPTMIAYRNVLTSLWLLDPIPAWVPNGNFLTRLGSTPKHQLADPALAARLLDLSSDSLLNGEGQPLGPQEGTLLGHLFESLVTLCVRVSAQAAQSSVGHLRTRNGDHEVDLILSGAAGKILAIEIKLSGIITDRDTKHLRWLADKVGDRLVDAIVINTGPAAYRRTDGIGVIPLGLLGD